jgi:hypothetical protein
MQIAGHPGRFEAKQAGQAAEGLLEVAQGRKGLEVSQMLGEHDVAAHRQGHGRLQVPAHGQDRRRCGERLGQGNRQGGIAAGPAQDLHLTRHHLGHRVVDGPSDRAVVDQEEVGDVPQAQQGLPLLQAERFFGDIPAGRHHREAQILQEQVMQRGRGQHDSQPGRSGSHLLGHQERVPTLQQDDRRGLRDQEPLFNRTHAACPSHPLQVGCHQSQGFGLPTLAFAQTGHGRAVPGIDQELKASQPLDRHDLPLAQRPRGSLQGLLRIRQDPAGAVPEFQTWATAGAGDRLGVEATVRRVLIFRPALGAHREAGHGRPLTVVRKRVQDAVARAAQGAVDEGVAVTAIAGIVDFAQAVNARSQIRQDQHGRV